MPAIYILNYIGVCTIKSVRLSTSLQPHFATTFCRYLGKSRVATFENNPNMGNIERNLRWFVLINTSVKFTNCFAVSHPFHFEAIVYPGLDATTLQSAMIFLPRLLFLISCKKNLLFQHHHIVWDAFAKGYVFWSVVESGLRSAIKNLKILFNFLFPKKHESAPLFLRIPKTLERHAF